MGYYLRDRRPSSFRKLAAAMWKKPNDPHIFGSLDIDATAVLAFLQTYNQTSDHKVTITHLVVRAVALTLQKYPELNAKVEWGQIWLRQRVDIFCQVATDGGRDLSGTKLEGADELSMAQLAAGLRGAARRIRNDEDPNFKRTRNLFRMLPIWGIRMVLGTMSLLSNALNLHLPSLGMPRDPFGSAMVTSVGMMGIDTGFAPFTPIARCPVIVAVMSIRERPWVVDGQVMPRPILRLCATCDHRIIDGYQAGLMTGYVQELLQKPELLLTEAEKRAAPGVS